VLLIIFCHILCTLLLATTYYLKTDEKNEKKTEICCLALESTIFLPKQDMGQNSIIVSLFCQSLLSVQTLFFPSVSILLYLSLPTATKPFL